jgi:Flp pilus assembly protein TadG
MTRRARSNGFAALEVAILTPAAILLMLVAVYGGRVYLAQSMVDGAAHAAARVASEDSTKEAAVKDATDMAMAMLAHRGRTCMDPAVDVDTTQFHPRGQVIVHVTCRASLQDLALLPLRGDRVLSGVGKSPIETYV